MEQCLEHIDLLHSLPLAFSPPTITGAHKSFVFSPLGSANHNSALLTLVYKVQASHSVCAQCGENHEGHEGLHSRQHGSFALIAQTGLHLIKLALILMDTLKLFHHVYFTLC